MDVDFVIKKVDIMQKEFNDTGTCIPSKHYMVDISEKLNTTLKLVEKGKYFIINRPRQFGKTTTIYLLNQILKKKKDYLPIKISFEGIGDTEFKSQETFCSFFLDFLSEDFYITQLGLSKIFKDKNVNIDSFKKLSKALTEVIIKLDKKVVLLIDEVDKSGNNQLFLHFLGMLRDKYLKASEGDDVTFHSVILAGLHDVKTLKLKLRPDEVATYNSPWNIAIDYKVDMSFNVAEIETMLIQYKNETNANLNTREVAEKLYFYTSGYPYLVSKLCKIIDEEIMPERWDEKVIEDAVKILLFTENNSNFDTVIKNLENNKELSNFIEDIILNVRNYTYSIQNPLINLAKIHGIIRNYQGKVVIHNKIYEEYISDYFVSKLETSKRYFNTVQSIYLKPNGKLDIKKVLLKFSEVIEEKYSNSDLLKSDEFLENNLRMLFLVFLKPIINGTGFSYKEAQISAERRLDVIVLFKDEKFIIELKLWYGEKYHKQGIEQIKDYLRREHAQNGYMIIMSKNKDKKFTHSDEEGIFTIWM